MRHEGSRVETMPVSKSYGECDTKALIKAAGAVSQRLQDVACAYGSPGASLCGLCCALNCFGGAFDLAEGPSRRECWTPCGGALGFGMRSAGDLTTGSAPAA